ncbi:YidH family protein [Parasulfitobacter algicola]|uniref:DUF202 domain-containing protein n=1 Tax=Parasulfitobacter algicola TaxID=2614809 RepID=A0ABX2IRJ3_9RHOB|nr:DUF202 domain-containing protein [Sulfitobacter algicola]NSX53710.1 DUF202 domain-containing protein [Sulfitobacter algicola]
MSKDSNEMAKERTDWAEDRTLLANERTFAGWMRTGMACVALALGLRAVFGDFEPTWIAKSVATIFIFAAVAIFWSARHKSCQANERFTSHDVKAQTRSRMTILASILTVGALATGVILWLL